jgi:hypothetical protein
MIAVLRARWLALDHKSITQSSAGFPITSEPEAVSVDLAYGSLRLSGRHLIKKLENAMVYLKEPTAVMTASALRMTQPASCCRVSKEPTRADQKGDQVSLHESRLSLGETLI